MRAMTFSAIVALLMPACAQRHDDSGEVVRDAGRDRPAHRVVRQPASGLCVQSRRYDLAGDLWVRKPCLSPCGGSGRDPERVFADAVRPWAAGAVFDPGKHVSAFSVPFDGNALTWTLGTAKTTLSSASATCPPPAGGATPVLGAFVLYARTMLRLDRPKIYGGDIGVAQVGQATDGRDELSLEPNTITDRTRRAFAATVDLRAGAALGAVFTNRLDNGGGTTVSVAPFAAAAMPALPTVAPVKAGTTPISVAIGQTKTLGPGAYGLVHVDGTLTLTGGTYQLARLELGSGGRVEASASAKLRVAGAISAGPGSHLRTNPVGLARDLLIEVTGTGTQAAFFDADSEVHALLTAPLGQLVFHSRAHGTGAFVARDIAVSPDVILQYEGGLPGRTSDCLAALQVSASETVPNQDPNDLPRMIAATGCHAPDSTQCEVMFLGNVNFDSAPRPSSSSPMSFRQRSTCGSRETGRASDSWPARIPPGRRPSVAETPTVIWSPTIATPVRVRRR